MCSLSQPGVTLASGPPGQNYRRPWTSPFGPVFPSLSLVLCPLPTRTPGRGHSQTHCFSCTCCPPGGSGHHWGSGWLPASHRQQNGSHRPWRTPAAVSRCASRFPPEEKVGLPASVSSVGPSQRRGDKVQCLPPHSGVFGAGGPRLQCKGPG